MGLFDRLKSGLKRSSQNISDGITKIIKSRKLDEETLKALENLLISADLGLDASAKIINTLRKEKTIEELTETHIKSMLATQITKHLEPCEQPLDTTGHKPFVILMTGINGAGKTTTIGKLAQKFHEDGKSVIIAAGDTYRAAAIEQLSIWADRTNTPIVTTKQGGDAAGLAFEALETAQRNDTDILLIDTAGRLHSNQDLMAELEKIIRVLKKLDDTAPHASLLVLDATTGQNALTQAQSFQKTTQTTGLIMTKLDGTARGGILVPIADTLQLPIHFIGVGESAQDLQTFHPADFAKALIGEDELSL